MKRREAIRNVIILGAGATWLASCKTSTQPVSSLKNIPLTGSQEEMLAALTETIIPTTTDFVGAKELQSSKFILVMADDCTSPEEQKKFMDGMVKFEETCQAKYSSSFTKCDDNQKLEFLKAIEDKTDFQEEVIEFYRSIKQATIQSFTSSQEYLTKIRNYSLVPPPFEACIKVGTV